MLISGGWRSLSSRGTEQGARAAQRQQHLVFPETDAGSGMQAERLPPPASQPVLDPLGPPALPHSPSFQNPGVPHALVGFLCLFCVSSESLGSQPWARSPMAWFPLTAPSAMQGPARCRGRSTAHVVARKSAQTIPVPVPLMRLILAIPLLHLVTGREKTAWAAWHVGHGVSAGSFSLFSQSSVTANDSSCRPGPPAPNVLGGSQGKC